LRTAAAYALLERQLSEAGLEKVTKDLAKKINAELGGSWEEASNEAADKAIKAFAASSDNTTGYRAMLAVLGTLLLDFMPAKDKRRITALVDASYRSLKENFAVKYDTRFRITELDKGVIRSLANDGPYWIGQFYDDHLSTRIADIGYQVTVQSGFGRVEAGRTMRDVLREEFRLKGGPSTYESTIPARFAGNVDNYSRIVSSNTVQRSRIYSDISSMRDAGIEKYRYSAVMDARTSEICQELNGKVFLVRNGVKLMNEVSMVSEPGEFKAVHPWLSIDEAQAADSNSIVLPPAHGMCRSTIVAEA
jgi:SPP1 gp7 family putative phage head morphogenesis protein